MVKQRMSVLDLEVQVLELGRRLQGAQVVNIYDVDEKIYTIKLSVPPRRGDGGAVARDGDVDGGDEDRKDEAKREEGGGEQSADVAKASSGGGGELDRWKKVHLLIESGSRIHTTNFDRAKGTVPSGFALKLRKHLRSKRLIAVRQFGSDRVLDLTFLGAGEQNHLVIEFYSAGNIVLTDSDYMIIALLRVFRPKESSSFSPRVVGGQYPVESARERTAIDKPSILAALKEATAEMEVRKALASKLSFGIQSVEHALVDSGLTFDTRVESLTGADDLVDKLAKSLVALDAALAGTGEDKPQVRGYIILKPSKTEAAGKDEEKAEYDEYTPYLLAQYRERPHREFESFDEAMDEFHAVLEKQREEKKKLKQENATMKKFAKLKNHLDGRVAELNREEATSLEKARLIEDNAEEVELIMTIFRRAIAGGMDWNELERMLKDEQKKGDPMLEIVHSLHFERNEITLMLNPAVYEEDSDEETAQKQNQAATLVDVDLGMTAHQNAQTYFQKKKVSERKKVKAEHAGSKALQDAEKKAKAEVSKVRATQSITQKRKPFWFEKFHWFISTQNYLVIAGRDAQQNELIVKRYMTDNDVYVHAEVQGAASVVVKNRVGATIESISPSTLAQAGTFAMCRSVAWSNRIVTSAWWVRPSQVSKTAPTGQYLTKGSFIIRGRKNFLPPMPLVFGLGMLFKVDEECIAKHAGERGAQADSETTSSVFGQDVGLAEDLDDLEPEGTEDIGEEVQEPSGQLEGSVEAIDGDVDEATRAEQEGHPDGASREAGETAEDREESPADVAVGDEEENSTAPQEGGVETVEDELKSAADTVTTAATADDEEDKSEGKIKTQKDQSIEETAALFVKFASHLGSDSNEEQVDEGGEETPDKQQQGRKYSSSKARKTKKKGGNEGDVSANAAPVGAPAESPAEKSQKLPKESAKAVDTPQGPSSVPRGKRSKLKRMKKKYGDQDEEEKELALKVLGASNTQTPAQEPEEGNSSEQGGEGSQPTDSEDKKGQKNTKAGQNRNPRAKSDRPARDGDDDVVVDHAFVGAESRSALDSLTGNPFDDDVILSAIPVCAPYNSVSSYKYKVKLLPGPLKVGKAYQQSLSFFMSSAGKDVGGQIQKHAMKTVPDNEAMLTMIPNVRVIAAGLQNAKQSAKSKSKAKSKAKKK